MNNTFFFFNGCAFEGNSPCNDDYWQMALLGDQWLAFLGPLVALSPCDLGTKPINDQSELEASGNPLPLFLIDSLVPPAGRRALHQAWAGAAPSSFPGLE